MKKSLLLLTVFALSIFAAAQVDYVYPSQKLNQVMGHLRENESAKAINLLKTFNVNDSFYEKAGNYLYLIYDLELKETNNALNVAENFADNLLIDSRPYFYWSAGKTAFYGEAYQRGIDILQKGIAAFPRDVRMYDYLGKNYIMLGKDSLAYDACLKGLEVSPFNPGLLENLGELNAIQKNYTQAAMAWYLGLFSAYHNADNYYQTGRTINQLLKLESVLKGNFDREVFPFSWDGKQETEDKYKKLTLAKAESKTFIIANYYEDIDKLLEGGLGINSRYKSRVKLNYIFAKQSQMMGDALKNVTPPKIKGADYFLYQNVLANLIEKVTAEQVKLKHFQSSILSITNAKAHTKMQKSYAKKAVPVNVQIQRIMSASLYEKPILFLEKSQKTERIFNTYTFQWDALGNLKDKTKDNSTDNREGVWEYFDISGAISSRGAYKDGKRDGAWEEYDDLGILKESYIYKDGELEKAFDYEENGVVKMERNFKNKELIDSFIFRFPDGMVKKAYFMPKGLKSAGTLVVYHQNGVKMLAAEVKNFDIQNSYLYYNKWNTKIYDVSIKDGKKDGPVQDYFYNGQLYATGNFRADKKDGKWEYFNIHGVKASVNNYKEGEMDGKQEYFDFLGKLSSEANYKKGKLDGDFLEYYPSGKLKLKEVYSEDKLTSVEDFDQDGKSIQKTNIKGDTKIESKYFNGKLRAVGKIKEGKKEGKWDYFSEFGVLIKSVEFKSGKAEGKTMEYFTSGAKYAEYFSKEDKKDGIYIGYYASGRKKVEGFYKNGERMGEWFWFYADGAAESHLYYVDGEQFGFQDRYDVLGKKYTSTYYKNDWNYYKVAYDSLEKSIDTLDYLDLKSNVFYSLNAAGDTTFKSGLKNNKINGAAVYNQNTPAQYSCIYIDGSLVGKYMVKDALGQNSVEKEYIQGDLVSYTSFNGRTGKIIYEAKYLNDEVHGLVKDYYPNGSIQEEINYQYGEKHGVTNVYAPDGNLVLVLIYNKGAVKSFGETIDNQILVTQASHQVRYKYADGTPKISADIKFGNFDNTYIIYNKDGKLGYTSFFKNAVKEGTDSFYDAKGQLIKTMVYKDGDNNGLVMEYENNMPTRITNYINDERHGWEYHFRNGKSLKSIYYYNADPIYTK